MFIGIAWDNTTLRKLDIMDDLFMKIQEDDTFIFQIMVNGW